MKDPGYLMLVIWFKVQRSGFFVWSIGVLECWMLVTGCSILDTGYWSLVRGKFNRPACPACQANRLDDTGQVPCQTGGVQTGF